MMLRDKVAVIYGASGDVGGATARAFAREGARVFLAARRREPLEALAKEIIAAGGKAEAAPVDALDGAAVEKHAEMIAAKAGGIDISFNAIDRGAPQGTPVIDMRVEDFSLPLEAAARTHFFTGTAAARQMRKKRSGVILAITANVARSAVPNTGAFGVACAMVEAICRQMAVEFGPHGIRVVCLRSGGSSDTRGVGEVLKLHSKIAGITPEELEQSWTKEIPLRRLSRIGEVANAAVLMASDYASAMTAEVANLTCGALQD
jgi:NAD(P)-dependent dehydrogenase (short-subunit alcohol dehydrogenase family)